MTWILIITIYNQFNYSNGAGVVHEQHANITSIHGFKSEVACAKAGVTQLKSNRNIQQTYICVGDK